MRISDLVEPTLLDLQAACDMIGNDLIRLAKGLGRLLLIERSGAKKVAQRKEIARLTAEVEQLKADKANLLFDLNKERAGNRIKGEAK